MSPILRGIHSETLPSCQEGRKCCRKVPNVPILTLYLYPQQAPIVPLLILNAAHISLSPSPLCSHLPYMLSLYFHRQAPIVPL